MAVRNFWIEANIDGRDTVLAGGPRSKDGGFSLTVKQRDRGGIITAATISGRATNDGKLILEIEQEGEEIASLETTR